MNRQGLIPLSALVVGGVLVFSNLTENDQFPDTKQWLGLSIVYMGISLANDVGFKPAGGFAALLAVTVFVSRGTKAIEYIAPKTGAKSPRRAKGKKRTVKTAPTQITQEMRY